MEDSERKIRSWQRLIPLAFPKFCLLLDDVPTTRKVFRRFHVASRHYLALPHRPLFRAEKKGDPVAKMAGGMAQETVVASLAQPRLGQRASGKHWWSTSAERLPNSLRLSSEQSKVLVLWQTVGELQRTVTSSGFFFGTGGSNAARRREAGPCRFSCGDRENSEARAGSEARGTVATNTVPQIPLACDTLSAERHPAPV